MSETLSAGCATAEERLRRVGFSWERLEKLARKALADKMSERGITLDENRLQLALEYYMDVGLRWADRYDVALARGVSFPASCYRRMKPRLIDFLREYRGDARRGTPMDQVPTDPSLLPASSRMDEETFEQLVESVSSNLTTRALWTLQTIGFDRFVLGLERWRVAEKRRVSVAEVDELLEEVGWQLRSTMREAA